MMNMTSAITGTVVLVVMLIICIALLVNIIGMIQESNKVRAKIKERRYLGFSDYITTILLSLILCIDVTSIITILYLVCKIWGIF